MADAAASEATVYPVSFSPMRIIQAEGARVGIVTCDVCGAAFLIEPGGKRTPGATDDEVDPCRVHADYHRRHGHDPGPMRDA